MKTDNKKIFFLLLVILAFGALFFYFKKDTPTVEEPEIENETEIIEVQTKTYRNDTYAFSFEYPEEYEVLEYTPSRIAVGKSTTDGFLSVADIALIQSEPENMQSFEEFVLDQARLTCAADGPTASISCIEIFDLKAFAGPAGSDAQTFYLLAETTDRRTGEVERSNRGPYYTFNTSPNTIGLMSFLMVHNPVTTPSGSADRNTLETIAHSLIIEERQYR